MRVLPVLLSTCCGLVGLCGCRAVPVDTRTAGGAPTDGTLTEPPTDTSLPSSFIRASGEQLVIAAGASSEPIQLRGMNIQSFWLLAPDDLSHPFFNDDNDRGVPIASLFPTRYDKTVVSNIASLGANVIRNAINFRQFEDNAHPYVYKPEGWALLDGQIALAKEAGLYTIIDMHVPPGGLQGVIGSSARLWEQPELRERTKALWQAIAERYRDEPWVAGYDPINEPMPTKNPGQWATFAQALVDSIRQVDPNHLIIIEEIIAVVDAQGNDPVLNADDPWIPKVTDDNVLYDFHFYKPLDFVGQGRPENGLEDNGQVYPDETHEYRDEAGILVGVRNKAYLNRLVDDKLAFQRRYHVPMNVGEFSPSRLTFFDDNAKGGLAYTADLMEILDDAGLSFQFYAYLNVFFLDWEYAEMPQLYQVTDSLGATLASGMRSTLDR